MKHTLMCAYMCVCSHVCVYMCTYGYKLCMCAGSEDEKWWKILNEGNAMKSLKCSEEY